MTRVIAGLLMRKRDFIKFLLASLGFCFGFLILLLVLQFSGQLKSLFGTGGSGENDIYFIIQKKIGISQTLGLKRSDFTPQEIAGIEAQPAVIEAAPILSNTFIAGASIEIAGGGIQTELFFEAVPDGFIDVDSTAWQWDENSKDVPVILSRDFINLYNFGYSASRGLPKITESSVGMVPFRIAVMSANSQQIFPARIVGFSDRLPTILVPWSFLTWANGIYGSNPDPPVSRVVIRTEGRLIAQLEKYLAENGYQTNSEQFSLSSIVRGINTAALFLGIMGTVISLLSLVVISLTVLLVMTHCEDDLRLLNLLGYGLPALARIQLAIIMSAFAIPLLLTYACAFPVVTAMHKVLKNAGFEIAGSFSAGFILAGPAALAITGGLLYTVIRLRLRRAGAFVGSVQ